MSRGKSCRLTSKAFCLQEGFGWLDPKHCHWGERGIYIGILTISGALLITYALALGCRRYFRDPRRHDESPFFGAVVAVPCCFYIVCSAGLLGACYDRHRSQEVVLYALWLTCEYPLCAYFTWLNIDAARDGLNARVFELPLPRAERRRLALHTAFHFCAAAGASVLLASANEEGEPTPLFSAEAYMRLRVVGLRESTCTGQEQLAYAVLLLLTVLLLCSAIVVGYTAPATSCLTWRIGFALPMDLQVLFLGSCAFSCFEKGETKEAELYLLLGSLGLGAFCFNVLCAAMLEQAARASKHLEGWLHVALLPYFAIGLLSCLACYMELQANGSLFEKSFIAHWTDLDESVEEPSSGIFSGEFDGSGASSSDASSEASRRGLVFFLVNQAYLLAIFSLLVHDPDESEEPPAPRSMLAPASAPALLRPPSGWRRVGGWCTSRPAASSSACARTPALGSSKSVDTRQAGSATRAMRRCLKKSREHSQGSSDEQRSGGPSSDAQPSGGPGLPRVPQSRRRAALPRLRSMTNGRQAAKRTQEEASEAMQARMAPTEAEVFADLSRDVDVLAPRK